MTETDERDDAANWPDGAPWLHPTPPVESPAPSNVSEYTPTDSQMRAHHVAYPGYPSAGAEYDRWLAVHDLAVQNDARREVIEWIEQRSPLTMGAACANALHHFGLESSA